MSLNVTFSRKVNTQGGKMPNRDTTLGEIHDAVAAMPGTDQTTVIGMAPMDDEVSSGTTGWIDCRSITKAVIGYLYLRDESINLTAPLGELASRAGMPHLEGTSVQSLLMMTAGLRDMSFDSAARMNRGEPQLHDPCDADYDVDFARRYNPPDECTLFDWCRAHKPLPRMVGSFNYDNVNYDILSQLAPYVLGEALSSLLSTHVSRTMFFSHTRHGHLIGSTGLLANSKDLAAFAHRAFQKERFARLVKSDLLREPDGVEMAGTIFDTYSFGWWIVGDGADRRVCAIGSQGQRLIVSPDWALCRLHATGLQVGEYDWMFKPELESSWSETWGEGMQPPHEFLFR